MPARILLMGAGSGAGNNPIASLRSALPDLVVVGVNLDPFILRKSAATRNKLLGTRPRSMVTCLRSRRRVTGGGSTTTAAGIVDGLRRTLRPGLGRRSLRNRRAPGFEDPTGSPTAGDTPDGAAGT